jgi:hypothetical protein
MKWGLTIQWNSIVQTSELDNEKCMTREVLQDSITSFNNMTILLYLTFECENVIPHHSFIKNFSSFENFYFSSIFFLLKLSWTDPTITSSNVLACVTFFENRKGETKLRRFKVYLIFWRNFHYHKRMILAQSLQLNKLNIYFSL